MFASFAIVDSKFLKVTWCHVVDLTFTPAGERADDIRLGVVRSVFHQPHGTFRGTVQLPDGELEIADLYGVCEDHDALW